MKFDKFLKKVNSYLDRFTEVQEVADNGLVEDALESKSSLGSQNLNLAKESMTMNDTRNTFNQTNNTTYSPVGAGVNDDLANLLKSTPDSNDSAQVQSTNVSMDTYPVYNDNNNAQQPKDEKDMTRTELFDHYLDIRDKMIVGFSDVCFDVINGIESSKLLTREQKVQKIDAIENEFLEISNDDFEALAIFFKKRKHELHMITNNVGEYDARVYENGLINDTRIKNYKIVELHLDNDLYVYLTEEDKETVNRLLDTCEEIHKMASRCNRKEFYLKETEKIMMTCNTIVDTIVAEDKFREMLTDLNVEINTSGGSTLLA